MPNRLVDRAGQQVGTITVLRRVPLDDRKRTYWVCVCECDPEREFEMRTDLLARPNIASCGCKKIELITAAARKDDSEIGYLAAHDRVRRARGRADEHPCTTCGNGAVDWALKKDASILRTVATGPFAEYPFSPDPDDYQAMCRSCHTAYDRKERRRG